MDGFLDISLRSVAVYLFMIIAIRVFGKKELSQLSITDLVLILLISNAVQNAMVGPDTSLWGGLIAAASLFIINYLFKLLLYNSPMFSQLIEGESSLLIYRGKVNKRNLQSQRITVQELEAVIREHGVESIEDVKLAILEKDGNISVLSQELEGQTMHTLKSRKLHPKHRK